MALPNFQQLYDEGKAQIEGNPEHQATDFSDGSNLDAYAGTAAAIGRGVVRLIAREVKGYFVSSSTGEKLQRVARDRYGLEQQDGESDDAFKLRIADYLDSLARGTAPALRHFVLEHDGRADGLELTEHISSGVTTLNVTPAADVDPATLQDELRAELDEWRLPSALVNINVEGA